MELEREGWLERRAAAGTYVAGHAVRMKGVELFFHERARRKGSFGERLLEGLRRALSQAGLAVRMTWSADGEKPFPDANWLPILWECPRTLATLAAQRRFGVVLNDRPPPGIASSYLDSVATDDFSGGVAAAELLRAVAPPRKLAVLAGPKTDLRSQRRVEGFQSHAPKSSVFWAGSWFEEDAERVAGQIAGRNFAGVFCCNDRLAQAFLATGTDAAVVGFDDAPIAEQLNLTTIAIPWAEITESAVEIARRRINGAVGAAAQLIFAPRSVIRATPSDPAFEGGEQ